MSGGQILPFPATRIATSTVRGRAVTDGGGRIRAIRAEVRRWGERMTPLGGADGRVAPPRRESAAPFC